jgi:hypothetical protein
LPRRKCGASGRDAARRASGTDVEPVCEEGELKMSPETDQKLFQIQTCQRHGYYAGHLPGARQALIGQSVYGTITVAVFDLGGYLQKVMKKNLPSNLLTAKDVAGYYVDEEGFQDYLKRELHFRLGVIRVREFRIPEEDFAVVQLSEAFVDFLKNPNDPWFTDADRQEYPGRIRDWIESGSFFLEWGNSFWLNKEGEFQGS